MKLYTAPTSILTLETWVQRTQAWSSANSARRLAFGQTRSYSVQPRLPLAATIHSVWAYKGSLCLGLYLYFVIPKHCCADGRKHR